MPIDMIPAPKKLERGEGAFSPSGVLSVYCRKELGFFAADISRRLEGMVGTAPAVIEIPGEAYDLFVSSDEPRGRQGDIPANESGEGYVLDITETAIRIEADSKRGFVNAWSTLVQLLSREEPLPVVRIADFPDLAVRGIHFDLKGCMPTARYLCEMLERLALHKINTVLIEYEDKFPYRDYPELHAETCLSQEDIAEFVETAKRYAIEVIPKVQCLGHVEHILQHERYRHLAENPTTFCPLKEGTWTMVRSMIAEVMACHPDSMYFHLGADEAHLGRCPECSEFVRRHGKEELYFQYVAQVAEYVASKNKIPIIWGDPFSHLSFIEKIGRLPRQTIIHFWDYRTYDEQSVWLLWKRKKTSSKRWVETDPLRYNEGSRYEGLPRFIEDLPQEEQQFISRHMFGGGEPDRGDALFWVNLIQDKGYTVLGGPAIKNVAGNNIFYTDFDLRYKNTAVWTRKAVACGLPGVVNTAWSRPRTPKPPAVPMELLWYNSVASAELCWSSQTEKADFDARFNAAYAEGMPLAKVIDYLSEARRSKNPAYANAASYLIGNIMDAVRPNLFLQMIELTAKYQQLVLRYDTTIQDTGEWLTYYASVQDRMPHRLEAAREYIRTLTGYRRDWLEWESEAVELLKMFMPEPEAIETVYTKTRIYVYRCENTIGRLREWCQESGANGQEAISE